MNRRRPIVRTIVAASVLTVAGCQINPEPEPDFFADSFDETEVDADASSEEVTEEVFISINPPLEDDASGPPDPEGQD